MDRLGWAVGASFSCFGVRIGLRANTEQGLTLVRSWLPKAAKAGRAVLVNALYSYVEGGPDTRAGTRRFHLLYRDGTRLVRSLEIDEVRRAFDRDLSMTVGATASDRIFVHAGVVSFKAGAILIPGKSFSGKTTLVRALVDQGGVYYSDEYAVLDSRGRVFPWAEPLSIRSRGPLEPGRPRSAEDLGLKVGRRSLPVRMVVLTTFHDGARFRPRRVSRAAGALGMLEHTLPAQSRPKAALRAIASAVSGARVIRGPRGDAHEAARAIVRAFEPNPVS